MYFYIPNIQSKSVLEENSAHFFTCRVEVGQNIQLTDGKGVVKQAKITAIDKKTRKINFELGAQNTYNQPENILFQASIDKPYLDKLVELAPLANLKQVYIFQAERSQIQTIPVERLRKIMIRSCEQSQTSWIPEIQILDKSQFQEKIQEFRPIVLDFVEKTSTEKSIAQHKSILVGPEGGFSTQEKAQFEKLKLECVDLGDTIFPSWLAGFVYFQKL